VIALAGHPSAFHVRLDGPPDRRCRAAMQMEHIDEATARDRLEETDRARARYITRLYDRDASDASLYHLVLDPTVIETDACVEIIATAADSYWRTRQ
jgi:cytidylate kinase